MPSNEKPEHDKYTQGLAPPRYGLKTFLGLVTLICACLAAFVHAGPLVGCAVLLALLMIIAHVAGNAIGTELRQRSDENSSLPTEESGIADDCSDPAINPPDATSDGYAPVPSDPGEKPKWTLRPIS